MSEFREILLIKGASKLVNVCAAVKAGETVLITTDYEKLSISRSLATAAYEVGAEPVIMIMPPRPAHGVDPPPGVAAAMKVSHVNFQPTAKSIAHTQATRETKESGGRVIVMAEFTEGMMISGGLEVDFEAQRPICEKMCRLLTDAKEARVLSELGTDITMSLEGRPGRALVGLATEPGGYSSPPNIEASIAPVEGTANGTIVVDASISGIGVLRSPVTIRVKDGNAVSFEGGTEAIQLQQALESSNDPLVYNVGELGIGFNPKARIQGLMLEDEGSFGSVHLALGSNADFGGKTRASRHIDNIIRGVTLILDGKTVLDKGEPKL
ncbi:MAG: aminopeptidase [Deltaproteobacteria bacterium]|nr:aminopeptidase [Deltaproteobacteria bacterium]MBW2308650.1 aminopeptidase [Deltaproteobacteria bacterium]